MSVHHTSRGAAWLIAAMTISCLVAMPLARAQDALGDGRALDANLQRGSSGVNPESPGPNFRAGNDVVTGNVPGLGYFHDDVGYGASGAFGDRLGEDDLFRFRAQSLSSGPGVVPGGYTLGRGPGQVGVFRTHTPTTAGDVGGVGLNDNVRAWGRGDATSVAATGLIVRPSGRSGGTVGFRAGGVGSAWDGGDDRERIGIVRQPEGRVLEVKASPLMGVRRRELEDPAAWADPAAPAQQDQSQEDESRSRTGAPLGDSSDRQPLGAWGGQVQAMVQRHRLGEPVTEADNQLVAQIEAGMFRSAEPAGAPAGGDVYSQLLEQMRRGGESPDGSKAQADVPGDDGSPQPPYGPAWLSVPTDEQLRLAEAAWHQAARRKQAQAPADVGDQDTTVDQGNEGDMSRLAADDPLQGLLKKLDHHLPRVSSLAGELDTAISKLMRQAQDDVHAGRYLDAQDRYQRVLLLRSDEPMARVGLIHAQIGAGLIRSAHFNLRWLFDRHPELIAVRYDPALLPDAERLKWISGQLMKNLQYTNDPGPALLLAYLGYQNEATRLVKFSLDLATAYSPNDPLITMLRHIWIDHEAVDPRRGGGTPNPDAAPNSE